MLQGCHSKGQAWFLPHHGMFPFGQILQAANTGLFEATKRDRKISAYKLLRLVVDARDPTTGNPYFVVAYKNPQVVCFNDEEGGSGALGLQQGSGRALRMAQVRRLASEGG